MEERFTFMLDSELRKNLEKQAKNLGMSLSTYVRMVLIKELNKEKGE